MYCLSLLIPVAGQKFSLRLLTPVAGKIVLAEIVDTSSRSKYSGSKF